MCEDLNVNHQVAIDRHVPAEFRGKARLFRDRITALSDLATPKLRAIVRGASGDCSRGYKGMRIGRALPPVEDKWRAVSGDDRLDLTVSATTDCLTIADTRLVRTHITEVSTLGAVDEQALIIERVTLDIRVPSPRHCYWSSPALATLNLHALGRFFERARLDDGVLLHNLRLLAEAHPALMIKATGVASPALIGQPIRFALPVTGGEWRGAVANLKEPSGRMSPCVHARTFVTGFHPDEC